MDNKLRIEQLLYLIASFSNKDLDESEDLKYRMRGYAQEALKEFGYPDKVWAYPNYDHKRLFNIDPWSKEETNIKSGVALQMEAEFKKIYDGMADRLEKSLIDQAIYGISAVKVNYEADGVKFENIPPGRINLVKDTIEFTAEFMEILKADCRELKYFADQKVGEPYNWEPLLRAQQAAKSIVNSILGFMVPPGDDDEVTQPGFKLSQYDKDKIKNDPWFDAAKYYGQGPAQASSEVKKPECASTSYGHDWQQYTGLNEQFYHCKHCGKKRGY